MLTLKPSDLRTAYETKSNSTTQLKNKSTDPHTKIMWIPIPKLTSSQFRPSPPNHFDPYNEVKSSSIPHTENKSISTTHAKTKWFLDRIQHQVDFDHLHKKQVNRYPH